MRTRILTLASATTLAVVLLAGCSGAGTPTATETSTTTGQSTAAPTPTPEAVEETAPAEQSLVDACAVAFETVSAVQGDMQQVTESASSGDFTALRETLGTLGSALTDAKEKVTNGEVSAQLTAIGDSVTTFGALFDGVADGDFTALQTKATEVQAAAVGVSEEFSAMGEICGD